MKILKIISLIIAILIIGQVSAATDGDVESGKTLSGTCVGCHGVDGNSPASMWPKLAGQHAKYIVKQLQDYQSGNRNNAIMAGIAQPLTEEQMHDLAAYFSSQKIKPGTAKDELVELGERIYRAGDATNGVPACTACHGPAGLGNPAAMYPTLGGQHADYTAAQMQLWQSGERANDKAAVMRNIAKRMTQEQIDAVSSYLQGLR
ncbi:MAG: c-type cytochrome [Pseudomonadota bacterium]